VKSVVLTCKVFNGSAVRNIELPAKTSLYYAIRKYYLGSTTFTTTTTSSSSSIDDSIYVKIIQPNYSQPIKLSDIKKDNMYVLIYVCMS
jgi:hypothetical protein